MSNYDNWKATDPRDSEYDGEESDESFAFANGTFQSDSYDVEEPPGQPPIDPEGDIDYSKYRKDEENNFPESYPAVVLLQNNSGFDRMGKIRHQTLLLVYLSDFEAE